MLEIYLGEHHQVRIDDIESSEYAWSLRIRNDQGEIFLQVDG